MERDSAKAHVDSYDFFAYLFPGLIVIAAVVVSLTYWHGKDLFWLYREIKTARDYEYFTILVLCLVCAYLLGHFSATFSAVLYDRIFVQKIFGYPYVAILSDDRPAGTDLSKNFYRSLVSLLFGTAVLFILQPIVPCGVEFTVIGAWCVAALVSLRWTDDMINHLVTKFGGSMVIGILHRIIRKLCDILFWFISRPFRVAESFVSHLMGLNKPFPPVVRKHFHEEFEKKFNMKADSSLSSEVHWLTYWYVCEFSPNIRSRLYKFLSLYGFTRNVSGSLLISSLALSFPATLHEASVHLTYTSLLLFGLAILLSIRFYYLYANYHSRSLYRGFLALTAGRPATGSASAP